MQHLVDLVDAGGGGKVHDARGAHGSTVVTSLGETCRRSRRTPLPDSLGVTSIIETSGLVMQFPSTRALDSLDVSIPAGVTGLVGANGAGKTTSDLAGARPAHPDRRIDLGARTRPVLEWSGASRQDRLRPGTQRVPRRSTRLRLRSPPRRSERACHATKLAAEPAIRSTSSGWAKNAFGPSARCRPASANG